MDTDDETQHLQAIRNILRHRQRLYELQQARMGERTTPDVLIGLAETKQELRLIEAKLRRPRIGADVMAAVGTDGLFLALSERLDHLAAAVAGLGDRVDQIETTTAGGAAWRETETISRRQGQWINRVMLAAIAAGVLLVLALLLHIGG